MDTRSAEKQVREIVEYVQSLQAADNKLYTKSKDRLKSVAESCEQIISMISKILQQEILNNESDGYAIQNVVDSIQQQAEALESLSSSKRPYISKSVKRQIIDKYKLVFGEMLENKSNNTYVNTLVKLIYDWINIRFFLTGDNFVFKFDKFPQWVCDIIIGYSESVFAGSEKVFVSNFYLWLDKLSSDPSECKYAIPSIIYKVSADNGYKSHITLTALVIYDILQDSGLNVLEGLNSKYPQMETKPFIHSASIYDLAEKYNPQILDKYRHYKYDVSVLVESKLTKEGM